MKHLLRSGDVTIQYASRIIQRLDIVNHKQSDKYIRNLLYSKGKINPKGKFVGNSHFFNINWKTKWLLQYINVIPNKIK